MGYQNTIVQTSLPSFPWNVGDKLDAVPLNNAFIGLQQQIDNLVGQVLFLYDNMNQANLGFSMTVNWGGNSNVTAGPYILMASAPYDFFITSMDAGVGNTGGSFDVQILVNNVAIPDLSVTVDNFAKTRFQVNSIVEVHPGDTVSMQISNIQGFPSNAFICINGQTAAKQEPIMGVGTGASSGISMALAVSTWAIVGSGYGFAPGTSTAQGLGMAGATSVARASGIATGDAHGVQVMSGGATGDAKGTSTATAQGDSQFPTHVLVLDDTDFGHLNVNPLG